jgi:hypothetical protein
MKAMEWLTPPDYQQSPITGWTRKHWEEVFFVLAKGIIASASPNNARIQIPGGPRTGFGWDSEELEGFARSFIMAAAWLKTSHSGQITCRGETLDLANFYRKGILTGTDPDHPEYWGKIKDYSQKLVECASLAWSLYLSRAHLWDQCSTAEKQQIGSYLFQCTQVKYRKHANNWLLFNVITNSVLKKLSMPYSPEQIDINLEICNDFYVGEGWYRDGLSNRFDYYNLWAFHYYHLIWAILDGDSQPTLAKLHRDRMNLLMKNFRYFFASDGSIPCFGRSSIYRFSYLGPITLGLYLNSLELDIGEIKTICHASMKFFLEHNILSDQNHLSLGYLYPCAAAVDNYSCSGSPYWAAKAFNIFLLPESDPFWQIPEQPLAIQTQSFSTSIKSPGFLLVGDKESGHIQLINQKSHHNLPGFRKKYTNFAYSSIFSYEARSIYHNHNCDNALTFSEDGVIYSQRWKIEHLYCEKNFAASRYKLYPPKSEETTSQNKKETLKKKLINIRDRLIKRNRHQLDLQAHKSEALGLAHTYILVKDDFMINVHRIETDKQLIFKEGGYPLGFEEGEAEVISIDGAEAVYKDGKISFLRNLYGYTRQYKACPFYEDLHGSNIRYKHSLVPALGFKNNNQKSFYLACMVYGKTGPISIENLMALVTAFSIEEELVQITFYDSERVVMQLGEIKNLNLSLNTKHLQGKVVMARVAAEANNYFILYESGNVEEA